MKNPETIARHIVHKFNKVNGKWCRADLYLKSEDPEPEVFEKWSGVIVFFTAPNECGDIDNAFHKIASKYDFDYSLDDGVVYFK